MNDPLAHIIKRSDTWRGLNADSNLRALHRPANSDWHGTDALPTGFTALNNALYSAGWPLRGSIEILSDSCGLGAMGLFLPAMQKLSEQKRWQAFIAPPHTPYAPLLSARGIDTQQILMVHPKNREERLWATEQALRSSTCSVVFSWLGDADYRYAELRKLQLAATENDTLALFFRSTAAAEQHTPASLRLTLSGYKQVDILKQRGGQQQQCIALEDEYDNLNMPELWELPVTLPEQAASRH